MIYRWKECYVKKRYWFIELTITASNPLASCRKGQGFPYSHFSYMEIVLTDIGSSSLRYKLIHFMTIISHPPWKLQEDLTSQTKGRIEDWIKKSLELTTHKDLSQNHASSSPLEHDQAFQPKLTKALSFRNLEGPKAMSFCSR